MGKGIGMDFKVKEEEEGCSQSELNHLSWTGLMSCLCRVMGWVGSRDENTDALQLLRALEYAPAVNDRRLALWAWLDAALLVSPYIFKVVDFTPDEISHPTPFLLLPSPIAQWTDFAAENKAPYVFSVPGESTRSKEPSLREV